MATPPAVTIVKASGDRVRFDAERVERACRRAGATPRLAASVGRSVAAQVREGMTTADIRALVGVALHREEPVAAARFSLKEAMRRLGPDGFPFERFMVAVLRHHGYVAELPELIPGMCVMHEVDLVARKDGVVAMAECKYRNGPGIYARLKDVMATWARYDDLRESFAAKKHAYGFTEAWIICNTKITSDGIGFAECKGMRCIAWRYPRDAGIETLIEAKRCYPLTILKDANARTLVALDAAGYSVTSDLAQEEPDAIARRAGIASALAGRLVASSRAMSA